MTQNYGKDFSVTALLDKMDFIIMPVLNVDGYAYTWEDTVGHGSVIYFLPSFSHRFVSFNSNSVWESKKQRTYV